MPDGLDDLFANDPASTGSGQSGEGGKLRAQLEQVLAENKALTDRLAAQEAAARSRTVAELFAKHSVPDLAKDLFPQDAEPTDEAVTALVEKYGALWGAQAATAATTPPEQQAATNAAQQFASQASAPPAGPLTDEAIRARMAETKNAAELMQLMQELQSSGG